MELDTGPSADSGSGDTSALDGADAAVEPELPMPEDVPADDVVEPADIAPDVDDEDAPPPFDVVLPEGPPATALRRWTPALVNDVLIRVDARGLTAEVLGGISNTLTQWTDEEQPTRPLGIPGGLWCWDLNGNGALDPNEDFNTDGQGNKADCALHPVGIPTGHAGVAVTVNRGAHCDLRVWTLSGNAVFSVSWPESCQPAVWANGWLVVASADGTKGTLRLIDADTGAVKSTVSLSNPPTTVPTRVKTDTWAVGMLGKVQLFSVATGATAVVSLSDLVSLSGDRPTAVLPTDASRFAVTVWRTGDKPNSFGSNVRQFVLGDTVSEADFVITTPTEMWGAPVAGYFGTSAVLVAGGPGWLSGWNAANGALEWNQPSKLGTFTEAAIGKNGEVYAAEIAWDGNPEQSPGAQWRVLAYDPADGSSWEAAEGAEDVNVRWIGSPLLLCDLMVLQLIPDEDDESRRAFAKPCAEGLAPFAYARSSGTQANHGTVAQGLNCQAGAGVPPCTAGDGCVVNPDCDDQNKCTIDSCVSGLCSYKFIPGCCAKDQHCEDFDPCTLDGCLDGFCKYTFSDNCCESSSECIDTSPCTVDICNEGFCEHPVDPSIPGCCQNNSDCPSDPCTFGVCTDQGLCVTAKVEGCCALDWDCNDANECTKDVCTEQKCENTPTPEQFGCCVENDDCPEGTPCELTLCTDSACDYAQIEGCCFSDEDCNDDNPCTIDNCADQTCENTADLTLEGCCETDDDCASEDPCVLSWLCVANLCEDVVVECDDMDPCTNDLCEEGECKFEYDPNLVGCCTEDSQCFDGDLCTTDVCDPALGCQTLPIEGCCNEDIDCFDAKFQTNEFCEEAVCHVCESFTFQTSSAPVDIIFAVDQSVSMTDKIEAVRTYLNDFAAFVAAEALDFHVVLVATRYKGENKICVKPPLATENCGDTGQFMQLEIQVGSHDALNHIMDQYSEYADFLRPNSLRSFVVMTDDESQVSAETFDFFLKTQPGFDSYTVHSIVGLDLATCATGVGLIYKALAAATGGLVIDICSPNWTTTFDDLGKTVKTGTTSFALSWPPQTGSIDVSIDSAPVLNGVAWVHNADTNRIELLEPLPGPGAKIDVCYLPQADLTLISEE